MAAYPLEFLDLYKGYHGNDCGTQGAILESANEHPDFNSVISNCNYKYSYSAMQIRILGLSVSNPATTTTMCVRAG